MDLYTERHGMRQPVESTSTITVEIYYILLKCCKKYYKNLTHLFQQNCHDDFTGQDYVKFDEELFQNRLRIKIPELFRLDDKINIPDKNSSYNQYSLLDLIEFIAQNAQDISEGWNSERYRNYQHINCLGTSNVCFEFIDEINEIFKDSGLLYTLTSKGFIERIEENSILTPEIEKSIENIAELDTKKLLKKAKEIFRKPNPADRKDALEKLWDAFERLKTHYTDLNKKDSAEKIVKDMSNSHAEFKALFNCEFKTLTDIGNNYRIRHHETDKIEITDDSHIDYLFNRCMSLIATAIKYLK